MSQVNVTNFVSAIPIHSFVSLTISGFKVIENNVVAIASRFMLRHAIKALANVSADIVGRLVGLPRQIMYPLEVPI